MRKLITLIFLAGALAGCSTQYRESTPLISEAELMETFVEIRDAVGGRDNVLMSLTNETLQDPTLTIFYHTRDSVGAPVNSVFSIADMNALDSSIPSGATSADLDLAEVDVIFMDSVQGADERIFSLMVRALSYDGTPRYYSFTSEPGAYQFSGNAFEAEVRSGDGSSRLILRSTDIHEDYQNELADSIKLKIYIEENGTRYYVGQISTMAGFGNR